jgi:hypothetical protein
MPAKLKRRTIELIINGSTLSLNRCNRGYYLGELDVCGTPFHVEAIEVDTDGDAINDNYQDRIYRHSEANDGMGYQRVLLGKKEYFVNIEVFAA